MLLELSIPAITCFQFVRSIAFQTLNDRLIWTCDDLDYVLDNSNRGVGGSLILQSDGEDYLTLKELSICLAIGK